MYLSLKLSMHKNFMGGLIEMVVQTVKGMNTAGLFEMYALYRGIIKVEYNWWVWLYISKIGLQVGTKLYILQSGIWCKVQNVTQLYMVEMYGTKMSMVQNYA